jgi:aspartate ammonia-lyase
LNAVTGKHTGMPKQKSRIEHDLLGPVSVPAGAMWGAQTQRAVDNFPLLNQRRIADFPAMVLALMQVKQAAALANMKAGLLPAKTGNAIIKAANRVIDEDLLDQFPIHHLHGGGGTSANMNANEVLANLAETDSGGKPGQYKIFHPNDHVNLSQSTNDVYPTACHQAALLQWTLLGESIDRTTSAFDQLAKKFAKQDRLARTCLQDAVQTTWGSFFAGQGRVLKRSGERIEDCLAALQHVNLGGTICGRKSDVSPAYFRAIIPAFREVTGNPNFKHAPDLFDAAQNIDDVVGLSGALDLFARSLIKICQDLRLLSSGPEAGIGELVLPAVQPGSSIMPGKVNPVIPEHAIQLCMRVIGLHTTCQATLSHGELDLNIWESAAVFSVLESMELLDAACTSLTNSCLTGLAVNETQNKAHTQSIIPRLTELAHKHGYSSVTAVCKQAKGDVPKLRKLLDERFKD